MIECNSSSHPHLPNTDASDDITLVIFNIDSTGPNILARDFSDLSWIGQSSVTSYLRQLATYTMIAVTQGSNYIEGVHLLPLGDHMDRTVLVLSILIEDHERPIHMNYLQVGLIVPKSVMMVLPNPVVVESELLELAHRFIPSRESVSLTMIEELKSNCLMLFGEYADGAL